MKNGDAACATLPLEWSPETLGTVVWKQEKILCGLWSAPQLWQEHLESILTTAGFVSTQLESCLWTHAGKRTALAYHVDDLLMVGTRQAIMEVFAELSTDLEIVASEVTSKPS